MQASLPTSRPAEGAYDRAPFGDLEEHGSFLVPFGLEQTDGFRRSGNAKARAKMLIIIGSVLGAVVLIIALVLGVVYGARRACASTPGPGPYACPVTYVPRSSDGVFFVVGDWGRSGSSSQQTTARMMAQVATCMPPQFVISTGDNFYPYGLGSPQDPQIQQSFTNVYNAPSLQVPWYAVLGNHDYGDSMDPALLQSCPNQVTDVANCQAGCCYSPLWQVSSPRAEASSGFPDPRWHLQQGAYRQSFPQHGLDIIFVDTTPLMPKYKNDAWTKLIGGYASQDGAAQKALVEALLSNSTGPLKLVVGHHPIRSYGDHCQGAHPDCDAMSEWLQPMLLKHKVAAYLSGHEHDLQFIKVAEDPVSYVVSGAGSNVRVGEFDNVTQTQGTSFFTDDQGFVAVLVRDGAVTLYYYVSRSPHPVLTVPVMVQQQQ